MHSRRSLRRGVSLLEVLVASFILLFGLLGVAAMFPVGRWYVEKASQYDRASAVGQAAAEDILIRGLLKTEDWIPNGDAETFLPVQFDPMETDVPATIPSMRRVTIQGLRDAAVIEHVFSSRDDLVVELPSDPDQPSFNRVIGPERNYEGRFSWMFTATGWRRDPNQCEQMDVAVVVFESRVRGNELTFSNAPLSGGYGGGIVSLSGPADQLQRLSANEWIHLAYPHPERNLNPEGPTTQSGWYRIIHAGDYAGGQRTLDVDGPDWGSVSSADVTIFDRVVAVYERTLSRSRQ